MANFIPVETTENKLSTIPVGDGNFIFCVDSGEVYVDTSLGSISSKRKRAVPRYIRSPVALLTTAGETLGLDSIGSIDDPIVDNTFTFVKENKAFYYFDSSATDAPNGDGIIQPAYITTGPGRWLIFTSKSAGSFPALQLTRPDFNGLTHLVIEASVLPSFTSPTVIINTATSALHRSKVYAYNGVSYIEHPAGGLDMTHSLKAVIVTMDMLSTVSYIRYKWTTSSGDSDWYATVFPSSAETVYTRITIAENGNWVINGLDTGRPARGEPGAPGTPGAPGAPGATGPANTLTIGTVTGGDTASATITGTAPTQILNLVLPKGDAGDPGPVGAPGPANTLSIGTVTAGETASATITGTAPTQTLDLVLPKGDAGAPGLATQLAVASTETTNAGTDAEVTIEGTPPAQVLRFKIPRGANGIAGSSIVWKGSLSEAPSTPVANWAYRNITDGVTYIYTGSAWTEMVQDGTPIVWKGVLSTAPESPQLNWAYRNSVSGKSYIYTGSTWDIIVEDGVPSIWKGSLSSAPADPELNWVYRNTTDGKVYIYNGSAWQLMVQDGLPAIWRGDSETPPTTPGLNDIYRNTTDGKVYIYDGSAWQLMVQDGRDPSFSIGTVQTGSAGTLASADITGDITSGYELNLTIPRGYTGLQGATGPANTLSIGTVTSDTTASAEITGTAPAQTLNLVLPKGDTGSVGPSGPATTLTVDGTTTGAAGTDASVSISGTAPNQSLSFTIPRGNIGETGPQGISIVWQGEFASAPDNPQINWVYYNTTNKKAYIYDGSAWVRIVEDGASIVWKGSLSAAPADPQLNWGYRNTTDGKSYIYDGASWVVMAEDGAPGESIFHTDITPLSGTPISVDAGGVYSWTVTSLGTINKGTWANSGLEYAIILLTISGSGLVTVGANITLVDPLAIGLNTCILQAIDGVIKIFVNPE